MIIKRIKRVLGSFLICLLAQQAIAKDFLITEFNAKPGLNYLNTISINKAIEACSKNGG